MYTLTAVPVSQMSLIWSLVSLDVPAIIQKIRKQNTDKYDELHQSLIDNYLVSDT